MYVRALSKHSYSCYMLQLLPDGLRENILSLLFHYCTAHPPVRRRVQVEKKMRENERDILKKYKLSLN